MQYLLTQSEYEALQRQKSRLDETQKAELQSVCMLAAMHAPVVREWSSDKTPRPWGCILGPKEQSPRYCDDCPAQRLCPHDAKEWSQ